MKTQTILIADDKEGYRAMVTELLNRNGYHVVEASTIAEARAILEKGEVDIAIHDVRMENHDDENDFSGLELAINTAPQIPKIILTGFPSIDLVRTAFRRSGGKLPPTADFVDKGEGPDALLAAIQKIQPLVNVFVVHGHGNAARLDVEKFLTQLHLNPIILKDLPGGGKVLLEKFERAPSDYAIVLLTPDDVCLLENEGGKKELRARQNVILEMGYFMGKLGRDHVCALYCEGVMLPSDIHGFCWIKYDEGEAWKIAVARELRGAGIMIDLNDILRRFYN